MSSLLSYLRYFDVDGFWHSVKLRNRVALVTSLLLLILFSGFSVVLFNHLSKNKRSYAYDAAFSESEMIASLIGREVMNFTNESLDINFIPLTGAKNSLNLNLIRWPAKNETFFSSDDSVVIAFARTKDDVLVSGSAEALISRISAKVPENVILLTSTGEVVKSGGRSQEVLSEYVREFTSAGVKKGVHNFSINGESRTFAFSEIVNTNLVNVSDVFVERAQQEIAELSGFIFIALTVFALTAAFLIAFLVRKSLVPLFQINEAASQIANGNFGYEIIYDFKDEVSETFHRISKMKTMLQIRDQKLKKTNDYLEKVLKIVKASILVSDKSVAVRQALSELAESDPFRNKIDSVYFQNDEEIWVEFPDNHRFLRKVDLRSCVSESSLLSGYVVDVADSLYISEADQVLLCDLNVSQVSKVHHGWIAIGPMSLNNMDMATISFLSAFVSAIQGMLEGIELKNVAVDRGRMRLALEAASKIQTNFVSTSDIPVAFDVAARSQSAETVGGDWYGTFYHEASKTVYCYMTDVTGHGLNSTLVVSSVRGAVEAMHLIDENRGNQNIHDFLSDCAIALDELIAGVSAGELTMTVCMVAISVESGDFQFLNFGHPAPLVVSKAGAVRPLLARTGVDEQGRARPSLNDALGSRQISKKSRPVVTLGRLHQGETLCFYTDGLIECTNSSGEMLGRRKARNLFSQSLREADGAADALTDIFSNIGDFVGGEPIADDISLLFVKRV